MQDSLPREAEQGSSFFNGLDPYEHRERSGDLNELPQVTFPDVFSYLVFCACAHTFEQFRNDKALEAHLQFTNGWVRDL